MADTYKLSLLSPRGKALEGDVEALVAPGLNGDLGVLARHAPLIVALRRGITQVTRAG
jgi:F-type H+-transporting ATPase subunit epsilon